MPKCKCSEYLRAIPRQSPVVLKKRKVCIACGIGCDSAHFHKKICNACYRATRSLLENTNNMLAIDGKRQCVSCGMIKPITKFRKLVRPRSSSFAIKCDECVISAKIVDAIVVDEGPLKAIVIA